MGTSPPQTNERPLANEKHIDGPYVALLDPHAYSYMETSCVSRTKTLLCTHIFIVWKDTLKSQKP